MVVLLWAFSAFNMVIAAASLGTAMRLATRTERRHWRSKRLLTIAAFLAWTFPAAAFAGVVTAWQHFNEGRLDSVPIILAPIAWLLLMGVVFAVVDFAEDGVLGNGRVRDEPPTI